MKLRIGILVALLILFVAGALLWTRAIVLRRERTANVVHDAEFLFDSLRMGLDGPISFHLAHGDHDAPDALGENLLAHASTLLAVDFKTLEPAFSSSDGAILATFTCPDGIRVTFTSIQDGGVWVLTAIDAE